MLNTVAVGTDGSPTATGAVRAAIELAEQNHARLVVISSYRPVGESALRAYLAPRVDMLIQYLYRDEVKLSRFQSGLVFADDRWKPSLQGFKLPFAQMGRNGLKAVVWGQIRGSRPGRKPYRLEVLRKNVWKPVGHARLTNDHGIFIRTIRLERGALLRIWSPRQRRLSLQLRIR